MNIEQEIKTIKAREVLKQKFGDFLIKCEYKNGPSELCFKFIDEAGTNYFLSDSVKIEFNLFGYSFDELYQIEYSVLRDNQKELCLDFLKWAKSNIDVFENAFYNLYTLHDTLHVFDKFGLRSYSPTNKDGSRELILC